MSAQTYSHKEQTERPSSAVRCINLDWLEVFAREPILTPHDPNYFRAKGYAVEEREYGTRVYRQMFVILDENGEPCIEVRRDPASQGESGIHTPNECHLRVVNRYCYMDNVCDFFNEFLHVHQYADIRISRIDVCLDFTNFDQGDDPAAFIRRYFRHRYAKINQGNIRSYGSDAWSGQDWNSLAWGSRHSAVGTKLYDKTKELYNEKTKKWAKPWIRHAWMLCGLCDNYLNVTNKGVPVTIWRVEFSLKSDVRNWVPIEIDGIRKNYQSIPNTLFIWNNRENMLILFASLARHYFRFKKFSPNKRKDRCPDKILFDFSGVQAVYKVGRDNYTLTQQERTESRENKLIAMLRDYNEHHQEEITTAACRVIINSINLDLMKRDLVHPYDHQELESLLLAMAAIKDGDIKKLLADSAITKAAMNISDRTLPFDND